MKKINEELLRLRAIIEKSKQEWSFKEGQLEIKIKELKEVYNVSSVEEAQKEIRRLEVKKERLEKQIQRNFEEIQRSYQW
jgi:acetyl-CoA carboxylase alpha subunit